ncbi:hypothetical protein JOD21_003839 [Jeotgalibacillus terrae]|nr:hypothetical protein [Jeotgalibacillus terrae]
MFHFGSGVADARKTWKGDRINAIADRKNKKLIDKFRPSTLETESR